MLNWVIIEDDIDRATIMINTLHKLRPKDKTIWYFINGYLNREDIDQNALNGPVDIHHLAKEEDLSKIKTEEGDIIFLLDIILHGVTEESLTHPGNIILPIMEEALEQEACKRVLTITSAQRHPIRQKNAFSNALQLKIQAGLWDLDSGDMDSKRAVANNIIQSSLKKWETIYGNPIENFFGEMAQLTSSDCHINERLIKNPIEKEAILAPLLHLSNLISYDFNKLLKDFNLVDDFGDYNYPNAFEEGLKQMGNKDANRVSLFGLILVCWSAFRKVQSFQNHEDNDYFFQIVQEKIDGHFRMLKQRRSSQKAELEWWALRKIIRESSVVPPQHPVTLTATMSKLFDMMQTLFIDETTKNSTLQQLDLDYTKLTFSVLLSIDGDALLQKLNKVFYDRMIGRKEDTNHKTSHRIIDFWLHSNYSSSPPSSISGAISHGASFWGYARAFSIENRNSGATKGITLKFSVW